MLKNNPAAPDKGQAENQPIELEKKETKGRKSQKKKDK